MSPLPRGCWWPPGDGRAGPVIKAQNTPPTKTHTHKQTQNKKTKAAEQPNKNKTKQKRKATGQVTGGRVIALNG